MDNEYGRIAKSAGFSPNARYEEPIDIADNVTVYGGTAIGKYTYINVGSVVYGNVEIGRFCSIGRSVEIGLAKHPSDFLSTHPFQVAKSLFTRQEEYASVTRIGWKFHEPTRIGNDVWIGAKVCIASGITIGDGAIIAAGAVVTKDVKPYSIVGGVPAQTIKMRFEDETIKKLIKLKWWDYPLSKIGKLPFNDIDLCIKELERIKNDEE